MPTTRPGYVAGGALLGFTAGVIVGGALWGGVNWGRGDVDINVNRYNNFNKTNISNSNWQHNASNRGAVPYKDRATSQQYGKGQSANAQSREQFRGHAEAGQQSINRGEVSRDFAGGSGTRSGQGSGAARASASPTSYSGSRDFSGTGNRSSFDTGGGGSQARTQSSRGTSSMSSARSSGYGGGGGGARGGGGGGGRGGGGRR